MTYLPNDVIGDAYRNAVAYSTLESLVDIGNRMAGQEGEARGGEVIADAFEDAGLRDVDSGRFEIPGWWRGSSELELTDLDERYDLSHQVLALPGTRAGDETAELVDVGHGTPEEFEEADLDGKLAMASSKTPEERDRWIHRTEKYRTAVEKGAVGFVFRNHVEGCLPPTGSIGEEQGPGPIPAVGVSRELGHRLVRRCNDAEIMTHLSVDCRNEPTESLNVSGVVGPDTDRKVLVTAHHDAHDIAEGAEDNGAGSVLVVEIGRLLARVEGDLDLGVKCVTFGAEEVGLYGSKHMAETANLDDIKAVVNLDGIGGSRQLSISTHGFEALSEVFEAVSDDLGSPIDINDGLTPHSDHWPFVRNGVPGVMARSSTADDGRGWGHTHADTLDKLDQRDFRDLAVLLASAVMRLADDERVIEAVDPDTIEQRAEEEGYEID